METYLSLIKAQPAFHLCVNTGVSKHDGLLLETSKQIRQTHKRFPVSELSQHSFHHQSLSFSLWSMSPSQTANGRPLWNCRADKNPISHCAEMTVCGKMDFWESPRCQGKYSITCLPPDINVIKSSYQLSFSPDQITPSPPMPHIFKLD